MPQKNSSPDRFARGVAIVGIVLSIGSLGLSYRTFHWQKKVHEEGTAEKILGKINVSRSFGFNVKKTKLPKDTLWVEVVNIGEQPLYIKSISIFIPGKTGDVVKVAGEIVPSSGQNFRIYDGSSNPFKLEPSQQHSFSIDWDFSKHPLIEWPPMPKSTDENVELQVRTTKRGFVIPEPSVDVRSVTVVSEP